ncbi:P-loop containing nucleoside triphosphate hydrolase protein [Tuber magnatum]|uniref:P-loop containing nucleoside triphosphate hydrolase protein n=1 Tax=Tuber magnatum TaxID=42249 RepID=A0A317T2N0_9PEZI|nr:P-loop containing nucleoside triphosphate hydrolase protein [Tuber magnatum]
MPPKKKSSKSSVADSLGASPSPAVPAASSAKKSKAKPGTNKANGTTVGSKGKAPVVTASEAGSSASASKGGENRALTTQQLIGGLSWTGKLPQALFYEHCAKAGWNKPDYYVKKDATKGFVASVTVTYRNPKTNLTESMRYIPPFEKPDGTPINLQMASALEAKHFAATYALHRVSSMKNTHMMLPPTHKGYWAIFDEIKRMEFAKNHAWMYVADPFLDKREWLAAEAAKAKALAEVKKDKPAEAVDEKMKGWYRVPVVDMGTSQRREVEGLVRKYHVWNPSGVKMTKDLMSKVVSELVRLDFKRAHVEEACGWVKDREEALEWLLIHVPEDDLPARFLPGNYATGVTFSSGDLPMEYAAKRLSATGYSLDLCREILALNAGDEELAAEALMQVLVYGYQKTPQGAKEESLISFSDTDLWAEEIGTLEAIWGPERYSQITPAHFRVLLSNPPIQGLKLPQKIFLEVRKPISASWELEYPQTIPTFTLSTEDDGDGKLSAQVKLSIIKQTAKHASTLLGEQMIFAVTDWLESNIARIVESPGRLRDVTSGVTGSNEDDAMPPNKAKGKAFRHRNSRNPGAIDWTPGKEASMRLLAVKKVKYSSPDMQKMLQARMRLPAWDLKEDIIGAVNDCQVTIISGETGSGKSTQAVQFILDDMIDQRLGHITNIICTQPRRISALGLADRVSDERCSRVGQEVGYAIRGESMQNPATTRITFVTTGVLLRRLQMGDSLAEVTHIFVDEVHERSLDTDFLLILLKRKLSIRKDLRVVLMSATLDAKIFSDYFGGGKVRRVEIKGRTFPVEDYYLDQVIVKTGFNGGGRLMPVKTADHEDVQGADPRVASIIMSLGDRINYNLIAATVGTIDEMLGSSHGGILIFLPGTMEIQRCIEAIKTLPDGIERFHALPLHASLTPNDQRKVFPPPPYGKRKVIAATNVAETSITIEDIVAVVDTGRVKETSYDPSSGVVKLLETWASRAACKQRRGRAGRVRAGSCWKLYTRNAEYNKMAERPEPELKRVPLEQTCLAVKAMEDDVRGFLAGALTPPDTMAVKSAMELLERMGAIADDDLTALGRHLVLIPADLRCSKLMVYGAIFGCLEIAVTIASILTTRSPFINTSETRDASQLARASFAHGQGDLLADCHAHQEWTRLRQITSVRDVKRWCEENHLSHHTLLDISSNRAQYISSLKEIGFLPLSSSSTLSSDARFLSYFSKMENNKVYLKDLTPTNAYSLLLFGGALEVDTMGRGITVDGWLKLRGWGRIGILVARLRAMLDQVLQDKIDNPGMELAGNEVVACVARLVGGNGV